MKNNNSNYYNTFENEYEFNVLYCSSFFNMLSDSKEKYDVFKTMRYSSGEVCQDAEHFIVMAELPIGQISHIIKIEFWNLFNIPIKEKCNIWDGHTPSDVRLRLAKFLQPNKNVIFGINMNLIIFSK